MKLRTLRDRISSRRGPRPRTNRPSLEIFEPRLLLSTGFVQGFALGSSNNPINGATVELLTTSNTLVATTTTNSMGYYAFNNLTPGTYNLAETSATYTASVSSSDIQTTINPATAINNSTEIQVQVLDPSQQSIGVTWTYNGSTGFAGDTVYEQLLASTYNLAGAPQNTGQQYEGQLGLALSSNQGNVNSINSFCSDLLHGVYSEAPFTAQPSLTPSTTTLPTLPGYSVNLGEIGYLYNTEGILPQPGGIFTSIDGAALQLALWSLEYNQMPASGPMTLSTPATPFQVLSPTDPAIISQANTDLSAAYGQSEDAYFLNLNTPTEQTPNANAGQGMFCTDLLNFTNTPKAASSVATTIENSSNAPIPINGSNVAEAPLGTSVQDSATVTGTVGGPTPTGTVSFVFYANATGTGPGVAAGTVALNSSGVANPSSLEGPLGAGSYSFIANYSGDNNYLGFTGSPEPLKIDQACPSITTTPNTTIVAQGTCTLLTDSAVLSGGSSETGTITFTLVYNGTTIDTESVQVSGNNTYVTPKGYSLTSSAGAGVYQWNATYSGNNNNKSYSEDGATSEQVWVITPCCNLTGVEYWISTPSTTTPGTYNPPVEFSTLHGNTAQGDQVSVTFTVPNGDYDELSLVAYTAPESWFEADDADLQVVQQYVTQVFGPGHNSIGPVTLPNSFYQVDFVCGTVITTLGLNSGDFYSAQSRLINSDNSGTNPVGSPELSIAGSVSGISTLGGVTITLTGTDAYGNSISDTTTSNSAGAYTFSGMPFSNASGYTVAVTVPSGDSAGSATVGTVNGTTDGTAASSPEAVKGIVMSNSGQTTGISYNFSLQQPANTTIAGEVYCDTNGDGKLESGDAGVNGVTVTLYSLNSGNYTKVASTATNSSGNYSFTNLAPGTYEVIDSVLSGYVGTGSDVGTVGGSADGTSLNATTLASIALSSGQSGVAYNFGIAKPVSLAGCVTDANGGVCNVTISLLNSSGTVIATTKTNSSGNYSFTNLLPGTYSLLETVPDGYSASGSSAGNDGGSSVNNYEIGSITLTSGETAGTGYNFKLKDQW